MTFDLDALLDLWTNLPADPIEAAHAFRAVYTDPVTVNGAALTADDLVLRARNLQSALENVDRELVDICDTGAKVAVAFRLRGRHIGPLTTAAGVLAPTGEQVSLRVIDILTLTNGRVSAIVMVADELGALAALNAVQLIQTQMMQPQAP